MGIWQAESTQFSRCRHCQFYTGNRAAIVNNRVVMWYQHDRCAAHYARQSRVTTVYGDSSITGGLIAAEYFCGHCVHQTWRHWIIFHVVAFANQLCYVPSTTTTIEVHERANRRNGFLRFSYTWTDLFRRWLEDIIIAIRFFFLCNRANVLIVECTM